DAGPIQVERIAGGNDQPDDRLLAPQILELVDHARQHRFGRRGAEYDQKLFLDVFDELQNVEARQPGNPAEYDEDEDEAGQVEGRHQLAKRGQRADAALSSWEAHSAETHARR